MTGTGNRKEGKVEVKRNGRKITLNKEGLENEKQRRARERKEKRETNVKRKKSRKDDTEGGCIIKILETKKGEN